MAKSIEQKYHQKKTSTLKLRPKIGFLLTLNEYTNLIEKSTVCDYTGLPFTAEDGRSLERIDPTLPYQFDNVCCVTIRVNTLKNVMDGGCNMKLSSDDIDLIHKIKQTLETKTRFELSSKYNKVENIMIEQPVTPIKDTLTLNPDIGIAKDFISFCASYTDSEVTLAKYVKLVNRKSCMYSGKKFVNEQGSLAGKVFIRNDMTKPFSDDNIKVVCLALSAIVKGKLFTKKELTKFMEFV